jgi:hypothetical protein
VLTLFPPVWGVKDKPDTNGSNGVLWAYYWTGHPFAAAIAAQEVREVRAKLPYSLAGLLLPALSWFLVGPLALLAMMMGLLIAGLLTRRPSFRRKLEILGQSVECVVRRDCYATPLDRALDDAANQLFTYGQFDGWSRGEIRAELVLAVPSAEKWAKSHAALIERAL